jgi:hypothetical protein
MYSEDKQRIVNASLKQMNDKKKSFIVGQIVKFSHDTKDDSS